MAYASQLRGHIANTPTPKKEWVRSLVRGQWCVSNAIWDDDTTWPTQLALTFAFFARFLISFRVLSNPSS